MEIKIIFILGLLITSIQLSFANNEFSSNANDINIIEFGAKPDGFSDNTIIIQKAIDQCSNNGGGTIYFPKGIFMSGTLFIKNNVGINLAKSAILKGIALDSVYPVTISGRKGFIRIDNVSNVTISGDGTIDGSGDNPIFQKGDNAVLRPFLLECLGSKNIVVKEIRLQNSASWVFHIFDSENVRVDGVTIYSHSNWNNDGIDINARNVVISNCLIDTDDDALCFKSESTKLCENVVVSNCILASNCNFIKFGTASIGGFKNIAINNCVLHAASVSKIRHWDKNIAGITDTINGIAGLALEIVDGGTMDQISISNISMRGVQTPIFMRLGTRKNPTGSLKNVLISNILATTHSKMSSSIVGVPGFYIENVVLRDVIFNCQGGGTQEETIRIVPENESTYPENRMFGYSLPAYGLYIRHAKNIYLDNIQLKLQNPDYRSAIWLDDSQGITIRSLQADKPQGKQPLIRKLKSKLKLLE